MNNKIMLTIITLFIIGGGIYYANSKEEAASDGHTDHTHDGKIVPAMSEDHVMNTTMTGGATLAGTRVILKNSAIKSGNQIISFDLYGKDGDKWSDKDLKVAHEKKMHFIMASSDFSDYQHLHPEFKDGLWQVAVVFKNNTAYQAYVDIDSSEDGTEILRLPINVGTTQSVSKVSQQNKSLTKDGIEVKLDIDSSLVVGKENAVVFTISKNGKNIIPQNYLGAKGHVVALGEDPDTFIHGHPDEHGDDEIHFAFTFAKAGMYTLFAQFQVDDVVRTYPFTVTVSGSTTTIDESKPHTDAVPHN